MIASDLKFTGEAQEQEPALPSESEINSDTQRIAEETSSLIARLDKEIAAVESRLSSLRGAREAASIRLDALTQALGLVAREGVSATSVNLP